MQQVELAPASATTYQNDVIKLKAVKKEKVTATRRYVQGVLIAVTSYNLQLTTQQTGVPTPTLEYKSQRLL